MRWRDMTKEAPPIDGADFIAISNTEAALVWFAPDMGARWAIMNLPGRGVRVASLLSEFHSWCPVHEWHRGTNMTLNPSYYGK